MPLFPPEPTPQPRTRNYRRPLRDEAQERLAGQVYQRVNARCTPAQRLSRANARRLVDTYDRKLIRRALEVIESRQNIHNPAGFLHKYLRSETNMNSLRLTGQDH